ncbi:hypothetical protein RYX36_014446 [Vicia faba]
MLALPLESVKFFCGDSSQQLKLRIIHFGYIVLTTSAGIMDHEEAGRKNVVVRSLVSSTENFVVSTGLMDDPCSIVIPGAIFVM